MMNANDIINLPGIGEEENELTKGQRIEQWLQIRYMHRFNVVKNTSEYRPVKGGPWRQIDPYYLNTVKRALRDEWYWTYQAGKDGEVVKKKAYLSTSVSNLRETIDSNFSPKVDVIKEYLNNLDYESYDGSAIKQLTSTISLADWCNELEQSYWSRYLKKWLVGMVANAMEDSNCKNHLCLVMVGDQGLRKGQWIEHLVQDSIGSQYIRTDGDFSPTKKDSMTAIATYWLIHLDDMLKRANTRDYNEIKNAITTPDIKVRLPYERMDVVLPHRASFIASVNDKDFLTDKTGARRFIPFHIGGIDWAAFRKINMHDVWTEAMKIYKSGKFQYWVEEAEETQLMSYKANFNTVDNTEELIKRYFRPASEEEFRTARKMTATDMMVYITQEAKISSYMNVKNIGSILANTGFIQKSCRQKGTNQIVKAYGVHILNEPNNYGDQLEES